MKRLIIVIFILVIVFLYKIITVSISSETIESQKIQIVYKEDLEEILTLNWGDGEKEAGYNQSDSIKKIAGSLFLCYGPGDFCIDKNENIYILDGFNGRVLKFKDRALYRTYYFNEGGYLNRIQLDNEGNLYIIINSGNRQKIFKYNNCGELIARYSSFPDSDIERATLNIGIDEKQNIYFLNYKDNDEQKRILEGYYSYVVRKCSEDQKTNDYFSIEKHISEWFVNRDGIIYFLSAPSKAKDNVYEFYNYADDKVNFLFSLEMKYNNENHLNFFNCLGIDDDGNFYLCENLRRFYLPEEKDNIQGTIVSASDGIIAHQGVVIYKYTSDGILLKTVKLQDCTPYIIKVSVKGNIYLTPVLATDALLVAPLDKYRIYKFII